MRFLISMAALFLLTLNAAAVPPNGTKLSDLILKIENTTGFQYVSDVDWDEQGYYQIEYYMKDGAKVQVNINPITGDIVK